MDSPRCVALAQDTSLAARLPLTAPVRVVLDASVLYPPSLRDFLLTLASLDEFELRWSSQILDEFERNVLADHPDIDPDRFRSRTIAAMTAAFPEAFDLQPGVEPVAVDGVHLSDQHVAATAVATGSDTILTQNLRHFPARALAKHQIREIGPGKLVAELVRSQPERVDSAIESLARRWKNPPRTIDEILDLLAVHPSRSRPMNAVRARRPQR